MRDYGIDQIGTHRGAGTEDGRAAETFRDTLQEIMVLFIPQNRQSPTQKRPSIRDHKKRYLTLG